MNLKRTLRPENYLPMALSITTVAASAVILRGIGRVWWCACGETNLWAGDIWSPHCSQHLVDPYAFTHVSHGLCFFWILALVARKWPLAWRFFTMVVLESAWEILENSPFIISRYRATTISLDYVGDSVINSLGDIACCAVGFVLVTKIGWKRALALFILMELLLLIWIRDNLTLNVVMLVYPIAAIRQWQMGTHVGS